MKKIKILFLITDLGRGGAERFLVDHCKGLSRYPEIEFKIGLLYNCNQYTEESQRFDLVDLEYETFSLFRKNENKKYNELLTEYKPDIIHSNRYLAEFITSYYLDKNITYVCHGHDNMIELDNLRLTTFFNKNRLLNFIEKLYLYIYKYSKVNTYFIANSQHTYDYYKKVLPLRQSKSLVKMDYGFQYDRFFDPKHRSIDSNKTLRILNVGSFQHKKNQNFIIDIALALKQKLNTFEIHLLGQGELYEAVKTRIKNHQLEDHIKLHGVVYNVHDWYKVSDIYIHTAYYEPFGLVFLEAMASGLPVVCLDGKGNRDIMEDGKNGYIIDEQNADTFAEWIYNLYTDQNLYSQISIYAQTFAKRFDIKLKIKEFVEFYTSIIGK